MDADEYNRTVKQRGTLRGLATRDINDLDANFQNVDETNLLQANRILSRLKQHIDELKDLDETILPQVNPDQQDADTVKVYEYRYKLTDGIADLELKLKQHEVAEARRNAPQQQVQAVNSGGTGASADTGLRHERVPEMDLTEFNGNPLDWEPFWDDFRLSVDARTDLTTITKFKLLRKCLTGNAAAAFKNYQLTVENYGVVKQILEERYGDKETAVALHLEALVKLKPANSHAVSELIRVRDECEAHIRALVILGFKEDTFGQLFAPILLSKLPKFVRLDIRKQKKQSGQATWSMDKLRETLSVEIELRTSNEYEFFATDNGNFHETQNTEGNESSLRASGGRSYGTASTLFVNENNKSASASKPSVQCVFCYEQHYSDACGKYKDVESRSVRLGSDRCFQCLGRGHHKSSCRREKRPCYHCGKDDHHRSLCLKQFGRQRDEDGTSSDRGSKALNPEAPTFAPENVYAVNTIATPMRRGTAILGTALVRVEGVSGSCMARVILDNGSTKSFMSAKLARKIGARQTGSEVTEVGRFGETTRTTRQSDTFEFSIILRDGSREVVEMSAEEHLAPLLTLHPVDMTDIKPYFKPGDLADETVDVQTEVNIDILMGLDYYYTFVGQHEHRCDNGLILKQTSLGYVITGYRRTNPSESPSLQMMVTADRNHGRTESDVHEVKQFQPAEVIGSKHVPSLSNNEIEMQYVRETDLTVIGRSGSKLSRKRKKNTKPRNRKKPNLRNNNSELLLRQLTRLLCAVSVFLCCLGLLILFQQQILGNHTVSREELPPQMVEVSDVFKVNPWLARSLIDSVDKYQGLEQRKLLLNFLRKLSNCKWKQRRFIMCAVRSNQREAILDELESVNFQLTKRNTFMRLLKRPYSREKPGVFFGDPVNIDSETTDTPDVSAQANGRP